MQFLFLRIGGVRLCIGAGFPSLVLKWIDAVADYIRLMDFLMPCWSLAMCSCSEYCRLDRDPFWSQWLFCKARGGCAQTAILLLAGWVSARPTCHVSFRRDLPRH
ncbi:hypothetical protein Nepgr_016458 [Nepenthes gracilis]|uniref:Uncharacterized protein n=1 Tax=Nepenthes gracilis TaxID=150966 RepID=A0AAD3SP92_NEPGR|nr:hypothetical protein Nepgr_016458 [Nepenthes gracilis]